MGTPWVCSTHSWLGGKEGLRLPVLRCGSGPGAGGCPGSEPSAWKHVMFTVGASV